ncbi:VTT domain-containing protein [Chloroflexota bacterium]
MNSSNNSYKLANGGWLRNRIIPLLILFLALAITVIIFLYREEIVGLEEYAYLGAFLISLLGNATIVLPVPSPLILASLAAALYQDAGLVAIIGVGLAGGVGAAIGETTGYMVGYSGRGFAQKSRLYTKLVAWVGRWGAKAIFIFSLVPFFPFDLAGVAAGILRMPYWKFILVCWLGRSIMFFGVALAGALGGEAVLDFLG